MATHYIASNIFVPILFCCLCFCLQLVSYQFSEVPVGKPSRRDRGRFPCRKEKLTALPETGKSVEGKTLRTAYARREKKKRTNRGREGNRERGGQGRGSPKEGKDEENN